MKKSAIIILIVFAIITANTCASFAVDGEFTYKTTRSGNKYITRFYCNGKNAGTIKTSKKLRVKIVESRKLKASTLTKRAGKYIIVERIAGTCTNSKGDGKTSDGAYISYRRVKGARKGAKYTTYCVYGNNNYIDDVAIRADIRK